MTRLFTRLVLGLLSLVSVSLVHVQAAQAASPVADPAAATVRRVALVVGANNGGDEREMLRYASSDAAMFAKVLGDLGGLDRGDRLALDEPSVAALERGFDAISATVRHARESGERVQFVFYYSGHSDETGLLLGGVHLDYKRLRALIDQVPADVRIAILDSCSSGAFTRFKGGKKREPFVLGASADVAGHAYLTSSSADEAAQESDRIGGSFFTHFLVTGLRGAADTDGDRRVTLNEAYRFAFDETLARTETTSGGPQHAAYDIQLAGTGDLVMTDLRKTSAKLEIASEVTGRIYVRDRRGNLAAELFKPKDAGAVLLALEPGDYAVTIDDGRNLHRASVEVRSNKTELLAIAGLEDVALEGTRLRGDAPAVDRGERPLPPPGGYVHVAGNIGLTPGTEINTGFGPAKQIRNNFSIGFVATGSAAIDGAQLGIGAVWGLDYVNGLQAAMGASISKGPMTGLQASIGASIARKTMRGYQASVAFNMAGELRGMQMAGVNYVDEGRGVQLGLINISRGDLEGAQIGLINIADDTDASIGLIPVTKKGGVGVDLWTSDVQLLHLGLRLRARRTYTVISFGFHPLDDSSRSFSGGFGLGGSLLARRRFSIDLDNTVGAVNEGFSITRSAYLLDTLRLSLAWRPAKHFSMFAAVTANAMFDFQPATETNNFRPGYGWSTRVADPSQDGFGARVWPGFSAGFQF